MQNLTHSLDTASQHVFKEHTRNTGNCYTDCTSVKFHAFVEKRIFLVLFMLNQQTSQELAAGVPKGLSPRKLNLK